MADEQDVRRRGRRVTVSLPITLSAADKSFQGTTHNISLLGAMAELTQPVPLGTAVTSHVGLPDGTSVEAKGLVVRCEQLGPTGRYGVGLFFNAFREGSEEPLSRWIEGILDQQQKEAERYFAERERTRLEKLERLKREKELKRHKRRKRGRPRKHPKKKAKRLPPPS